MGLFSKKDKSSKSGSSSPAPSQTSSYAAPPPPYGAPPQEEPARNVLFGNRNNNGYPDEKKPSNPYASAPVANPYGVPPSSYGGGGRGGGSGGYGGYGEDSNRDALFGNRQQGGDQQRPSYGASDYGRPSGPAGGNGRPAGPTGGGSYGSTGPRGAGYGEPGYGEDRQLTAEEEEEEDVEAVKQQIRFTKQESVASTRNALRAAAQAEETGRATLERLGQQGERLHNTEKNLDLAHSKGNAADKEATKLKHYNRSMFIPAVSNPMGKKNRQQEEARILAEHQAERDSREQARADHLQGHKVVSSALSGRGGMRGGMRGGRSNLAERSKYQFEHGDEDDEMENEIDDNLDQIGAAVSRLNMLAQATGEETDRQNAKILQLAKKSDAVDDRIMVTHNRIKKIH